MKDVVSVSVSGPAKPVLLEAPVPVAVTVKNPSARPVTLVLPYPNPNDLSFTYKAPAAGKAAETASAKKVQPQRSVRSVPVQLGPGQEHAVTYYLNRYLRFAGPGPATVGWRLAMRVTVEPGTPRAANKQLELAGEIAVNLVAGSEAELRSELEGHAAKLGSDQRQTRAEAAEALAFLDTPVAVDYIARMLPVDGLATIGVQALGRLPSPRSTELIVGTLSHPESGVVMAALQQIDAAKLPVPRDKVHALLASDNPNVRWAGLEWLSRHADPSDLPKVTPLIADSNGPVAELARRYRDQLRK